MEALVRLAVRRPIAVTVMAFTVAWLGALAWGRLPVDLLPDLESPTIMVSVRSGDRPPVELERLYGEQVEKRLFTVRGVRQVSQVARTGRLLTTVVFDWSADMDLGLIEVQKAVSAGAADPEVDEVLVRRFDPRRAPILRLGLLSSSGRTDLAELRRLAERQLGTALEQLHGVAEARVTGGREKEVRVEVDPHRLEAYGLRLSEIESRLQAANIDLEAGSLEHGREVFLVRSLARFTTIEDVAGVVVGLQANASGVEVPVHVSDVAGVRLADRDVDHLVRVDGREGVSLAIYKEAGANTVEVSRRVRIALASLAADLPTVEVRWYSDAASVIESSIDEVEAAAGLGVLLAILVLILFLRSASATMLVASAVPVSILSAVFLMRFADQGLNIMTLAGLAVGAGLLVDNAIVVVESIHRHLEDGEDRLDAVAQGTAEVGGAILASTLTTCVIFLPVLFVRGLAARLMSGISFTVVISLLTSLAAALILIPALAGWLLPTGPVAAKAPMTAAGRRLEVWVLQCLRRPGLVVLLAFGLTAVATGFLLGLGSELLPPSDPRHVAVEITGPAGQGVESTAAVVEVIESVLRDAAGPDFEGVLSEVGRLPEDQSLLSSRLNEENTGRVAVRLAPGGRRASTVVAAATPALDALPETHLDWQIGGTAFPDVMGTGGAPVAIELTGRSLEDLRRAAADLRRQLATEPSLWNVSTSFEGGPPELRVVLDRVMADGLGVGFETISRVLEASLEGRRITAMTSGDEERPVVLYLPSRRLEDLASVPFTTAGGARLTLGDVARFEAAEGAREIFRRNQQRLARVTARIAAGHTYPESVAAARRVLEESSLPSGLTGQLAGDETERGRTFGELRWAALFSMVLVFMVLAGTFESLRHPLTVLASAPLALTGVALALVPTGRPVGVMALLGFLVLVGVAVNDAILLVATARRSIVGGMEPAKALARAAANRLRPIAMTTATTVLALAPLALGGSAAASLRRPFALTLIGGILASTVASLVVIPCLYQLLDGGPRFAASTREAARREMSPGGTGLGGPIDDAG